MKIAKKLNLHLFASIFATEDTSIFHSRRRVDTRD